MENHKNTAMKFVIFLQTIAAFCTIMEFIGNKKDLHPFTLSKILSFPIPFWVFLILTLSLVILYCFFNRNLFRKNPDRPKEITNKHLGSEIPISGNLIDSDQGSFSTWIYLHQFGSERGIREKGNRYILSHATNKGKPLDKTRWKYSNVFSLGRNASNEWQILISNKAGETKRKTFPDSQNYSQGWHHFLVRWDFSRNILEFLIDGKIIIKMKNYVQNWPQEFEGIAYIGTWASKDKVHYINTYVWNHNELNYCIEDNEIKDELKEKSRLEKYKLD